MKRRQRIVRIVALLLALIMAGGVLVVALSARAAAMDAEAEPAKTGEDPAKWKWPALIGGGAMILLLLCTVLPKLKKKP